MSRERSEEGLPFRLCYKGRCWGNVGNHLAVASDVHLMRASSSCRLMWPYTRRHKRAQRVALANSPLFMNELRQPHAKNTNNTSHTKQQHKGPKQTILL